MRANSDPAAQPAWLPPATLRRGRSPDVDEVEAVAAAAAASPLRGATGNHAFDHTVAYAQNGHVHAQGGAYDQGCAYTGGEGYHVEDSAQCAHGSSPSGRHGRRSSAAHVSFIPGQRDEQRQYPRGSSPTHSYSGTYLAAISTVCSLFTALENAQLSAM